MFAGHAPDPAPRPVPSYPGRVRGSCWRSASKADVPVDSTQSTWHSMAPLDLRFHPKTVDISHCPMQNWGVWARPTIHTDTFRRRCSLRRDGETHRRGRGGAMTKQTRERVPLLYVAPGGGVTLSLRADRGHPIIVPATIPATNPVSVAGTGIAPRIGSLWPDSRAATRGRGRAPGEEAILR